MNDPLLTVRRRLFGQRLAGEPFDTPAAAVRWLGAVQAQEFAEAKWSLAQRSRDCTDTDVEAAIDRGEILRTHVLRPTWHFVASSDVRWLLRLTRPRVHGLNRYWYARFGLDERVLSRGNALLTEALDGEPLTRRELAERLRSGGIDADGLRLGYLLMHAELEELICSGPRRGKQHTYTLFTRRVPASDKDELSREQAVAELVLRYFNSHGPATIKDFTSWSSLTVADTKAGLERVHARLDSAEDDSGAVWYAAPEAAAAPPSSTGAYLIPMYDETVVAYQDLRVVLAHQPPRGGLLDRAIVIDGRTVGSWKRTLNKRAVLVEATLFGPLAKTEGAGRFLGLHASLQTTTAGTH
ncbi:MAG: winged helix DNA-binding domain-containing protein [Actinomycetota bacterium]|nr:winged helix DNA-binding domain-containing protein [Actinomycetota bacterium]